MRVRDALRQAREKLRESEVEDPGFETEYLLRSALGCTREFLLIALDSDVSSSDQLRFDSIIDRRAAGEPSAYITGHKEFYGLDFKVDPRALIPRPETELLVELALECAARRTSRVEALNIAEVGVGCGAIAIALAVNLSGARVTATDISPTALKLASENVSRHCVEDRVTLLEGDLLQPVSGPIDILVSNPPYIPSSQVDILPREIRDHEPRVALDGGEHGMILIERLICQAKDKLRPGGAMFVEIGWDLGDRALARSLELWPESEVSITPDLAGLDRVLTLRSPIGAAQPV